MENKISVSENEQAVGDKPTIINTLTVCVNPIAVDIDEQLDYAISLLQRMKDNKCLEYARLHTSIPRVCKELANYALEQEYGFVGDGLIDPHKYDYLELEGDEE